MAIKPNDEERSFGADREQQREVSTESARAARPSSGENVARDDADPAVCVLTLNRPARYNALTTELKVALLAAVDDLAKSDDVRALVLTGAGKAFCVGQDLGEHAEALRSDPSTVSRQVAALVKDGLLERRTPGVPPVERAGIEFHDRLQQHQGFLDDLIEGRAGQRQLGDGEEPLLVLGHP